MDETRLRTIEQLQHFLNATPTVTFTAPEAGGAAENQRYEHISRVLARFDYPQRSKRDRGLPQRIRAHSLVCFIALILYRVMRMRLKASGRKESPTRLLEHLRRIHQQTVQTTDGQTISGITELAPEQKSLFSALELPHPKPSDLKKPPL